MDAIKINTTKRKGNSIIKHVLNSPFIYLMAIPGLFLVLIFNYIPMYGVIIAFKEYNVTKGVLGSSWVGFKNFEFFFSNNDLFKVVRNTLVLNTMFILFATAFGVGIALFLNEIRHKLFKRVSQSLIFLPYFMSWIIVGMIVRAFLGGQTPTIDIWMKAIGLTPLNWYFEPDIWPWILTFIKVWQGAGYLSIIFLATITSIPDEIYEAAKIDGASRAQAMYRITLPLLIPTISILTILAVGKIFNGDFAMIYAIVGDNSLLYPTTDVIDTFVFRSMRILNDFGMSSAVGLFQSVMGFIFVVTVNWLVRRFSKDSALF